MTQSERIGAWKPYARHTSALVILLGVPVGLRLDTTSPPEAYEWLTPASLFAAVVILQLLSAVLLRWLHRPRVRVALTIYYTVAAFAGVAVSLAATRKPTVGPFVGVAMSIGVASVALTAVYVLLCWDRIRGGHSDAAGFLGSTHVLALVAAAATMADVWAPGSSGWTRDLLQ